jgi:acyl-coenzyme A thioesterase 9
MNEYHRKQQQHLSTLNNGGSADMSEAPGSSFDLPFEAPNKNIKWVKDTIHKNVLLMHSQNMNVNGKIFGGYIMRKSFEAAHLSAALFYGTSDIQFSYVDDIQFVRPVHVGSIIEFVTHVAYSRRGYCVTHCNCYELDIVTNIRTLTNVLHYVFKMTEAEAESGEDGGLQSSKDYVEVIPREYKEILAYLEGKRTLDSVQGLTDTVSE